MTVIDEGEIMISFGVTTLFTSIDPEVAKESMTTLLHSTSDLTKYTKFEITRIMDLINLHLTTYFLFTGQINQQIIGTLMEPPFSGCETVTEHLESTALPCTQLKIWIWYIDDTFVIMKKDQLEKTHEIINKILKGIKSQGKKIIAGSILVSRGSKVKLEI